MPPRTPRSPSRFTPARRRARIGSAVATLVATAGISGACALAADPGVAVAAGHAPTLTSVLEPGSTGSAVARVQRALHVPATGRFGTATRRAVRAFQRGDGLAVDGLVGPQTWNAIFGVTPPSAGTVASGSATGGAASGTPSGSAGYSIPTSIVMCESGGNYSAVNPSSGAGGAYQILPSTWQAYGGTGLPQDAPPAEQDRIAAEIYAQQGPSAWTC